jgi:hypothetical protein
MKLYRITLELARNPGQMAAPGQGYSLLAPLTADQHLDIDTWRADPKACRVLRRHPDPDTQAEGWLTHRGNRWFFRYDEDAEGEEETVHRLAGHVLREGEYLTVDFEGDTPLTYKITDISPI